MKTNWEKLEEMEDVVISDYGPRACEALGLIGALLTLVGALLLIVAVSLAVGGIINMEIATIAFVTFYSGVCFWMLFVGLKVICLLWNHKNETDK